MRQLTPSRMLKSFLTEYDTNAALALCTSSGPTLTYYVKGRFVRCLELQLINTPYFYELKTVSRCHMIFLRLKGFMIHAALR